MDRTHAVEPAKSAFATKANVRRAIEAQEIPFTYVSSNFFAGYFLPNLSQPGATAAPRDRVIILGDGNPKGSVVWMIQYCIKDWLEITINLLVTFFLLTFDSLTAVFNKEEDIGTYTINSVDDPRTLNKILYIRPPANTLSFNELVTLWEGKIGKTLERIYVPEEQLLKQIEG